MSNNERTNGHDDSIEWEDETAPAEGQTSDVTPRGEASETPEQTDAPTGVAERLGNILAQSVIVPCSFVKRVVVSVMTTILHVMPFVGAMFWKNMAKNAVYQYQKASGADAVTFNHGAAGMDLYAVDYVYGDEEDDEPVRPGWKAKAFDKTWGAGADGREVERMGKADVIMTDEAAHQAADALSLRVAEALDLENVEGYYDSANVTQLVYQTDDPADMSGGRRAMADGGTAAQSEFVLTARGAPKDAVIDLSPTTGDGMRISARKFKHLAMETATTEEMQAQETRGFLAGKEAGEDGDSNALKYMIIAGLFGVAVGYGDQIIAAIFGGGGGGGGGGGSGIGGVMPFMLDATSLVTSLGVV